MPLHDISEISYGEACQACIHGVFYLIFLFLTACCISQLFSAVCLVWRVSLWLCWRINSFISYLVSIASLSLGTLYIAAKLILRALGRICSASKMKTIPVGYDPISNVRIFKLNGELWGVRVELARSIYSECWHAVKLHYFIWKWNVLVRLPFLFD